LNFSFSDSAYWVRTTISNPGDQERRLILELSFPLQDYLDVYIETDGGRFIETRTGDRRDFSSRAIEHQEFLFRVTVPPGAQRDVYLRFGSEDGLHESAPLVLWDTDAFAGAQSIRIYVDGAIFGILLVMLAYNLFVFVSLRDPGYLYYVFFIFFAIAWLFSYQGLAFRYLWPDSPEAANRAIPVFLCLIFLAHIAYAQNDAAFVSGRRDVDGRARLRRGRRAPAFRGRLEA
jgi:hypothetical protein